MLQITKFEHSCLLVSMNDRHILIDPGVMSSELLRQATLPELEAIVVTHVHGDHLDAQYAAEKLAQSPQTKIYGPTQVMEALRDAGVTAIASLPEDVTLFESKHEDGNPLFETPDQQGYHLFDVLTHPGDSHHFEQTKQVLALPVTAPWGASTTAMKLAIKLKPKYVIPIHDWHWSEAARYSMYQNFTRVLKEHDIIFVSIMNDSSIEVDISA